MRLNVKEHPETRGMQCIYWPILGTGVSHVLEMACGFDTDEKWVEIYIPMPISSNTTMKSYRLLTSNGKIQKAKLYIDFDIIDKETKAVLYSVKQ